MVRLEKGKEDVSVNLIYGASTIGWENSALDQWKFYEMKFNDGQKPFLNSFMGVFLQILREKNVDDYQRN